MCCFHARDMSHEVGTTNYILGFDIWHKAGEDQMETPNGIKNTNKGQVHYGEGIRIFKLAFK